MRVAGASRAFVVIGGGKWDVPAFLGDGSRVGLDVAYLVIDDSPSTAHTIARACGHLGSATTVLGFPDLVLRPDDALATVVERHRVGDADVVLGLFTTHEPSLFDMVETAEETVLRIIIKPAATNLRMTWLVAAWGHMFTRFLNQWVDAHPMGEAAPGRELYIGDAMQAAIEAGLTVVGMEISEGGYDDAGVPGKMTWRSE